MKFPETIRKFIEIFSKLPGIGPRQAMRLAFYFVHQGFNFQSETARTIAMLKKIKICSQCFFIHENTDSLCDICRDEKRQQNVIAIVEKETDLLSIERTKKFDGRYLILGDLRKSGVLEAEQKLRIKSLANWIRRRGGMAEEIIIALNPTPIGDLVASFIIQELKNLTKKISRLGRGIPTGGEIEFADEATLESALERRS